jgi:hypothetical protein
MFVRQSTTRTIILPAPVTSAGAVITDLTGIAVRVSKAGAAFGARSDSTTVTQDGTNRMLSIVLNTTDTNTAGTLDVSVTGLTSQLPLSARFEVLTSAAYDALMSTGRFTVDLSSAERSTLYAGIWDHDISIPSIPSAAESINNLGALLSGVNVTQVNGTNVPSGRAFPALDADGQVSMSAINSEDVETDGSGHLLVKFATNAFVAGSFDSVVPPAGFFTNASTGSGGLTTDQANQLSAIHTRTAAIAAGRVTIRPPVAQSGALTLYAGDDYSTTTGNPVAFTLAPYTDSAPSSVVLSLITETNYLSGSAANLTVTGTATLVSNTLTASFALTSAQTLALAVTPGDVANYRHRVEGVYSGERRTLVDDVTTVVRDV